MTGIEQGPLNILVVDDSAVVREVMTAVLSQVIFRSSIR